MEEYIKIYEECKDKKYHDPKLEPVIKYLYDIVETYNWEIKWETRHEKGYKAYYRETGRFMKDLITIFNKIIDSNNYEYFDEFLHVAWEKGLHIESFFNYLNTFYNKEEYSSDDYFKYYFAIRQLTFFVREKDITDNYNFPLFQMLNHYKKISLEIQGDNFELNDFFNRYAPVLIGDYYLHDYSLEDLDSIFMDFINNYKQYLSYFLLNGVDEIDEYFFVQSREVELIRTIISNHMVNKKTIR